MKILTKDKRLLTLVRIGEAECEKGSNKITCRDATGENVVITWDDVELVFGSYNFIN